MKSELPIRFDGKWHRKSEVSDLACFDKTISKSDGYIQTTYPHELFEKGLEAFSMTGYERNEIYILHHLSYDRKLSRNAMLFPFYEQDCMVIPKRIGRNYESLPPDDRAPSHSFGYVKQGRISWLTDVDMVKKDLLTMVLKSSLCRAEVTNFKLMSWQT